MESYGVLAEYYDSLTTDVDYENWADFLEKLFARSGEEIRTVIEAVTNTDWRMVLRYRYIHNCTWEQIGAELNADSRTIRRWHSEALKRVVVPENPIQI